MVYKEAANMHTVGDGEIPYLIIRLLNGRGSLKNLDINAVICSPLESQHSDIIRTGGLNAINCVYSDLSPDYIRMKIAEKGNYKFNVLLVFPGGPVVDSFMYDKVSSALEISMEEIQMPINLIVSDDTILNDRAFVPTDVEFILRYGYKYFVGKKEYEKFDLDVPDKLKARFANNLSAVRANLLTSRHYLAYNEEKFYENFKESVRIAIGSIGLMTSILRSDGHNIPDVKLLSNLKTYLGELDFSGLIELVDEGKLDHNYNHLRGRADEVLKYSKVCVNILENLVRSYLRTYRVDSDIYEQFLVTRCSAERLVGLQAFRGNSLQHLECRI